MAGTFEDWYYELPLLTKWMMLGSVGLTLVVNWFALLPVDRILLDFPVIFGSFEVWRLFSNLLYFGKFSIGFVMNLYILVSFSRALESTRFQRRTSEYLMFLLVGTALINATAYYMNFIWMAQSFVFLILHLYSQVFPDSTISFFFGFQVPARYISAVVVLFDVVVTGNSPTMSVVGIVIAHLYFMTVCEQNIVLAPRFLAAMIDEVPPGPQPAAAFAAPPVVPGPSSGPPSNAPAPNSASPTFVSRTSAPSSAPQPPFSAPASASASASTATSSSGYRWGSGGRRLGTN